jgi:hypothetical protein
VIVSKQKTLFDGPKLKNLIVSLSLMPGSVALTDAPMLNGKVFGKCSGEDLRDIARFLQDWADANDERLVDEDGERPSLLRAIDDEVLTYLDFRLNNEKEK